MNGVWRFRPKFLYPHGAVYIFENTKAQRVKVGMTAIGANDVANRLSDVNDMWLERKVTCQICGRRCVNIGGHVPHHVGNVPGNDCPGGNALPLEKDVAVAESLLESMKNRLLRGGPIFSDTGISGFLAAHDRREVHAKAETEPFCEVQGASGA